MCCKDMKCAEEIQRRCESRNRRIGRNNYGIVGKEVKEYFTSCKAVPCQKAVGELNRGDYDE